MSSVMGIVEQNNYNFFGFEPKFDTHSTLEKINVGQISRYVLVI
jgi:hypothetical protein